MGRHARSLTVRVDRRREPSPQAKRILFYSEGWGAGGIEAYIVNLASRLDPEEFSFDIYSTHDAETSPFDERIGQECGERLVLFPGEKPGLARRFRESTAAFVRLLEQRRYDIAHICCMNATGFEYARIAQRHGVPVRIAHSHNSDVGEGGKAAKRALHLGMRALLPGAETARLACSEAAGKHMFGAASFVIVRNGIDTQRFTFDASARKRIRAELGIGLDTPLIGSVARLSPQKNPLFQLDVFAEIARREPRARCLMMDRGEMLEEVRVRTKRLGIADKVIWFSPRADIEAIYSALDLMLFPSLFEGLDLVRVEAQCSGLPTLASDCVPVEGEFTGLVEHLSLSRPAAEWAENALGILSVQRDRRSHADEAKAAGYDVADTAEIVMTLYRGEVPRQ